MRRRQVALRETEKVSDTRWTVESYCSFSEKGSRDHEKAKILI